jgi:hypothetical protein
MKRILSVLLVLLLATALPGCTGDKDKGQYKDKDLPRQGPPEK